MSEECTSLEEAQQRQGEQECGSAQSCLPPEIANGERIGAMGMVVSHVDGSARVVPQVELTPSC
jgi:hypothetical protein